jgi:hypothetical protein
MKLQDFNTLDEAKAYSETQGKLISPDMMLAMLTKFGLVKSVLDATTDEALALKLAFQFGSEFNLINNHQASVKDLLDKMVTDGLVNQAFVDYAIAYANPVVYPFADTTLTQFNNAKGIYSQVEVSGYNIGSNLKITLLDALPESCSATTWHQEEGFEVENLGRAVALVQGKSVYKLDINNTKVLGKLFVRIPLESFNFTVEVV